jgi:hypothetical protein
MKLDLNDIHIERSADKNSVIDRLDEIVGIMSRRNEETTQLIYTHGDQYKTN